MESPASSFKCEVCGGILVIGKGNLNEDWCPTCEGIEMESVEDSKNRVASELKNFDNEIENTIKKYYKEDLLITVYVTRESVLHSQNPDYTRFIAYSSLLNKILALNYIGKEGVKWDSSEIQNLYTYAEMYNQNSKFIHYILNGLVRYIFVKKKDMAKYNYDLEKSLKTEGEKLNLKDDELEESVPILKFTSAWRVSLENLKSYGIVPKNEAYFNNDYQFKFLQIDEFWKSVLTKVLLEMWAGNSDLLEFPEFKDSLDYLKVWENIANNFPFKQTKKKDQMGRVVDFSMQPVDLTKIFYQFFRRGLGLDYVKKFIADINSKFKKGFPVFLLTSKGLFVGQETTLLVSRYLKAKYARRYLDSNKDVGNEFVLAVAGELERLGFNVRYPKNPSDLLVNIVDNKNKPSVEIDLIAYTDHRIFLIECKHVLFTTDLNPKNRENNVKRNLRDELPKMDKRVEFLSNHLQEFGLEKFQQSSIKAIFVTFNEEPIHSYEGIEIVAFKNMQLLDPTVKNEEFITNSKGATVYANPLRHELLEIPEVTSELGAGDRYNVLSVGLAQNSVFRIPLVTVEINKRAICYRLPAQLLGWALVCIEMSDDGISMFPSEVEFGYIVSQQRFYAHIL